MVKLAEIVLHVLFADLERGLRGWHGHNGYISNVPTADSFFLVREMGNALKG